MCGRCGFEAVTMVGVMVGVGGSPWTLGLLPVGFLTHRQSKVLEKREGTSASQRDERCRNIEC
jgi:hypothetical protein